MIESKLGAKWSPKDGTTVLDKVDASYLPHFRYSLLRNGHVVSMYYSQDAATKAAADRAITLPLDTWVVKDRLS